jgi:hypothetical protein
MLILDHLRVVVCVYAGYSVRRRHPFGPTERPRGHYPCGNEDCHHDPGISLNPTSLVIRGSTLTPHLIIGRQGREDGIGRTRPLLAHRCHNVDVDHLVRRGWGVNFSTPARRNQGATALKAS